MENSIRDVEQSNDIHDVVRGLVDRTTLDARAFGEVALVPVGLQGSQLDLKGQL